MTENTPREITADFIRELRKSGKGDVADKLLKAHYDSLKKVKTQEGLNFDFKTRQVKRHLGICSSKGCTEDVCEESISVCEYHFGLIRKYTGYKGRITKYSSDEERKEALRKHARSYYQKNKEKVKQRVSERYFKNKEKTK